MTEKLKPPFRIRSTDEAYWIEDAAGLRFGYCYHRDPPIVGTDNSGRLTKALALRTVKSIARMATEAAEK